MSIIHYPTYFLFYVSSEWIANKSDKVLVDGGTLIANPFLEMWWDTGKRKNRMPGKQMGLWRHLL